MGKGVQCMYVQSAKIIDEEAAKEPQPIVRSAEEIAEMTNGDRIRSMSDEELAVTIMCPAEYDLSFDKNKKCGGEMNNNCRKCCYKWLKSKEVIE